MPLSVASWSSSLMGRLSSKGMVGTHLLPFCETIAKGSILSLVGKTFTTSDVGSGTGGGVGIGVGITGLNSSFMVSEMFSLCASSFGQSGIKLMDFLSAISETCVEQLFLATLSSSHFPVFIGTGAIVIGTISVSGQEWSSNIQSSGAGVFNGSQWGNFAKAIGTACANNVLQFGTGIVTITGAGGSPSPSVGSGSGVIS